MKHLKIFELFSSEDLLRSNLLDKADKVKRTIPANQINCETFCIYVIGDFKTFPFLYYEKISKNRYYKGNIEEKLKIGDVISFGPDIPKHYAIYIGNGRVLETEGWGEPITQKSMAANLEEYEDIIKIYRDENIINNFRH